MSLTSRKRLLFLHTGGTLGMTRRGEPGPLEPSEYAQDLLPYAPGLHEIAHIEGLAICNLDSSDMSPPLWEALAEAVYSRLDRYDGFVVLHGTDTMAYSACALSYMLENLPRPVVLTGSQRPIAELRTDAVRNLIHSAICATMDLPEVGLYFGSCLMRGNRATKESVQDYHAFASPNFPALVEMGVDVVPRAEPLRPEGPPALRRGFCEDVAGLMLIPGQPPRLLDQLVEAGARAVVLRAFGEGNLPQRGWPDAVRRATDAGVAVVVGTQCARGRVQAGRYRNSALLLEAGAVFTGDMTFEAAIVKTMWLLGQGLRGEVFRQDFERPRAGDRS